MNTAKFITKAYFFGAMGVSAIHTVHSFEKLGLHTGEQWLAPLAIDGFAMFGLVLQNRKYDDSTNRTGVKFQVIAGIAQLASNIFAASSLGGMVFGIMVVGIYLVAELIGIKIRTRAQAEAERAAQAEADAKAAAEAEEAAKREAKNAAARARRQAAKTAKHSAELAEARRIRAAERALAATK